ALILNTTSHLSCRHIFAQEVALLQIIWICCHPLIITSIQGAHKLVCGPGQAIRTPVSTRHTAQTLALKSITSSPTDSRFLSERLIRHHTAKQMHKNYLGENKTLASKGPKQGFRAHCLSHTIVTLSNS